MASGGYPGAFETGKKITGLAEAAALPDVAVFHAGTKREGDSIVTSGGRVLGVTATADSLPQAIHKAYEAADKIHFEGAHYRTDIGAKGDLKIARRRRRSRVAEVLHLFQCLAHGEPMREFEEVFAIENKGFQDCLHGRSGSSRQVLLMDMETLEEFGIAPGRARENITTRGIALGNCRSGSGCAPAKRCSKSRSRARRATRWTKFARVFRKRFAGGAACCAGSSSPAASAGATVLKLEEKARAPHR